MSRNNKDKKGAKRPSGNNGGGAALMQQMGFSMPNFDDPNIGAGDDVDEGDLEAELELLQQGAGGPSKARSKTNQKKPGRPTQDLQSLHQDVNKLLNDIDRPMNDDELSGDENELLSELQEMTGEVEDEPEEEPVPAKLVKAAPSAGIVGDLEARLAMYKKAVDAAKASGDAAKSRRYDRQYKLIQELLQNARAGKPVDQSEIPPVIGAAASAAPSPAQPANIPQQAPVRAPPPPSHPTAASLQTAENPVFSTPSASSSASNNTIERLKALALEARANGDMDKAKEYIIQMKNLQKDATAAPAPSQPAPAVPAQEQPRADVPDDDNAPPPALPLIAPVPTTILEALQQRYEEFAKRHQDAISKGESSKARRMERLKNQYKEAMDANRRGLQYDYSELGEMPGFAPIPLQQPKAQPAAAPSRPPPAPVKPAEPVAPVRPTPSQPSRPPPTTDSSEQSATKPSTDSLSNQIIQLKALALQARERGDMDAAKKYFMEMKSLEQTASSTVPALPSDASATSESGAVGFDTIREDEFTQEVAQSSREVMYRRLTEDLIRQIQLSARNQQIYAHMGGANNLARAKEFQNLEQRSNHDLERLKQSAKNGSNKPVFHYEKRQMHLIQFNNDLTDDDLEVTIVRGINLQVPSGYSPTALETYVIIDFPYPTETPPQARTRHAVGSANAEYADPPHKFPIRRNDTKLRRGFGRKELKLSIYYRAGFLRADRLLGVAFVKLVPLDEYAIIHESVDIYENDHRKKPHGKLEVKIRIRDGLGPSKASELSPQRWLVIDRFDDVSGSGKSSPAKSTSTSSPSIAALSHLIPTAGAIGVLALNLVRFDTNTETISDSSIRRTNIPEPVNDSQRNSQQLTSAQSIQVLRYEADRLAEQIVHMEEHFSDDQIAPVRKKQQVLKEQCDQLVENLRQGGKQAIEEHVRGLEQLLERYTREEEEYRQRNETKKADVSLEKKNLVVKEIDTLTGPVSV